MTAGTNKEDSLKLSEILNFRKTVSSLRGETISKVVPFTGAITQVSMHFPAGCNSLVEVRLYSVDLNGEIHYIVPSNSEEYIALDDVTQPFNISYIVTKGSILNVEILNHDSVNSHTITTIVVLKALPFVKTL